MLFKESAAHLRKRPFYAGKAEGGCLFLGSRVFISLAADILYPRKAAVAALEGRPALYSAAVCCGKPLELSPAGKIKPEHYAYPVDELTRVEIEGSGGKLRAEGSALIGRNEHRLRSASRNVKRKKTLF